MLVISRLYRLLSTGLTVISEQKCPFIFSIKVTYWAEASLAAIKVDQTGAPNENIVQNHLNIALLNVF